MQIRDLIPWGRDRGSESRQAAGSEDDPVSRLQHDINRVFDDFWSRFERQSQAANGAGALGPSMDVSETDEAIEVSVELPGMDEKDVEVNLSDDVLTIRGEKKHESEARRKGMYVAERAWGAFYRMVPLPPGVDTDKASAEFRRGVLTVTLPKTPEAQAKVKRIEVKAA